MSSILLWKVFTLFLKRPFYHFGNINRTYTRNNIILAPVNIEKDISFKMTIHQMAFDEYTSNTFCMLWQIARMQVPCRLVEYKKYSCPLSSKYSWDSSNLQVGSNSSNVFEQSSSSNREMSFDGSSFRRIRPSWPFYLDTATEGVVFHPRITSLEISIVRKFRERQESNRDGWVWSTNASSVQCRASAEVDSEDCGFSSRSG